MNRRFSIFAWSVLAYNILVVLWGAYVRATGSGAGCGNHWPLCDGQVVPRAQTIAQVIEFTHRLTSGLALVGVVILVIWAYKAFPRGNRVRTAAMLSGVFILTEALIGASLVLLEHVALNASVGRAWSLSLHLVNTFTLLAVLTLTALWSSVETDDSAGVPRSQKLLLYGALFGLVLLGVSGAITALGDTLFPVKSLAEGIQQDFAPGAPVFIRLRVFHPTIAIVASVFLMIAAIYTIARSNRQAVSAIGIGVVMLTFTQLMIGAMNLALLAPVTMQLIHLLFADLVWIATVIFTSQAFIGARVRVPTAA